ncbi:MAG TPA: S41 family peptidase [Puia sp.]
MRFINRSSVIIFICVVTSSFSFCQTDYHLKKMSPDAARKDLLIMRDTLEKIHAGLYRYKSKTNMDRLFDSCYRSVTDTMTIINFYTLTRYIIASIEDGHSNSRLSDDDMNEYVNNAPVFPAMVLFIHDRAFILCSKQNDSMAESELLSINDHPAKEIIERSFKYIQSDAGIESHKNWELPEYFQLLYYALYGAAENFTINYKTRSGHIQTTTIHADLIKNIICAHPFTRPNRYLTLEYKPGNIALLTLKTFFNGFLDQTKENFSSFLDSAFTDIKNKRVEKLIIDVRSNQGGNDNNGETLYSYLTDKPFSYYASQETTTEKFSEKDHTNLKLQEPEKNNFAGKVFILANGRSFSGVAEFSSIVKTNNRGLFIGEECGGGYYGNTSGDEANVTLPNSKIIVRIPMIKYTMAIKKLPNGQQGIKPDLIFYHSITDIAEHRDSQLEYALKIVSSK